MDAGKLDRIVTIQQFTESRDAVGQPVKTWHDLGKFWANVKHDPSPESKVATGIATRSGIVATIRYCKHVEPKQRLLYNNRIYDILNAIEVGRGDWTQMQCASITDSEQG